jgi:transglutaminase-like putative cysteine protease
VFGLIPRKRVVSFRDAREKADFLDAEASRDSLRPRIREFARRIALGGSVNDEASIVEQIHAFVRDAIPYVRDPSWEEFADSETILGMTKGRPAGGDCDDKARLFVALSRGVGIDARILPVFDGDDFVHVQAQVAFPHAAEYARARGLTIEQGGYLRVELILKGCALGQDPKICGWDVCRRRVYTDGHG